MSSNGKVFVLGLGANKAGTTWLYKYLNSYNTTDFGALKEYHVWDGLYSPECLHFKVKFKEMFYRKNITYRGTRTSAVARYAFQNIYGLYEFYFRYISMGDIKLTGDITPSYAVLTAAQLSEVKNRLNKYGFTVKVVFFMRDPVERCWSAVRMNRRDKTTKAKVLSEFKELKEFYSSDQYIFRTRYDRTIQEIEKVFPDEDIFYGIFEELFTRETIERLSCFLGLEPKFDFVERKINASPKRDDLDLSLQHEIREFYDQVYNYCYIKFPQTRNLWN